MQKNLRDFLKCCPFIAILRGVQPAEAVKVAAPLVDTGFTIIEVPLNSPRPLDSIRLLAEHFGGRVLIGAGTVLTVEEVDAVATAGGRLAVSPNTDAGVVARARACGLTSLPGAATPSEAFTALTAGADGIKMFPAETLPPAAVKAWRAVMPRGTLLLPVGGISSANIQAYRAAGADGFGIGSALYRPGRPAADMHREAGDLMRAWNNS